MSKSEIKYQNIINNCINCNKCYNSCIMLQELGSDFRNILDNDKLKKGKNRCCSCGLCSEVCPLDLDVCGYYRSLKQEKMNPIFNVYFKTKHKKMIEKTNE